MNLLLLSSYVYKMWALFFLFLLGLIGKKRLTGFQKNHGLYYVRTGPAISPRAMLSQADTYNRSEPTLHVLFFSRKKGEGASSLRTARLSFPYFSVIHLEGQQSPPPPDAVLFRPIQLLQVRPIGKLNQLLILT